MARKVMGRKFGSMVQNTAKPVDTTVNVLLWGLPGVGKTHFIKTAPKPFIIAAEKGLLTIAGSGIPYIQLNPEFEVYNSVMYILNLARKKEKLLDDDGNVVVDFAEVETIAVDSITKLNAMVVDEIAESVGSMRTQDWGDVRARMSAINNQLMALPYNIVCTGGETIREDQEDSDKVRATLNMQGGYRDVIMYEYDFNIYMTTRERGRTQQYWSYTQDRNKRTAKSRADLPAEIENLNFDMIADAVKAKLKGE